MKRILVSTAAVAGLFAAVTIISNSPLKGDDRDRNRGEREDDRELEVQIGFSIAPVKLNLEDKDPELVGLGSYIVNAQGGCNDCHTCPSYAPGQVVLFAFPGIRRSSALGKSTIQLLEISRALWLARFPG